jgi:hydrogenase expression/formation protein HypE
MRRCRPRLIDEVVTLGHGADGKSSAALVDAVFVEAFRNPELGQLDPGHAGRRSAAPNLLNRPNPLDH